MKILEQDAYAEPPNPAELDDHQVVIHRRTGSSSSQLVIFVHGLGGQRYGRKSTWGNFPKFIFEDMPGVDVGLYKYETLWDRLRLGAQIPLETEADAFAGMIRDEFAGYRDIILIGHSMGGLLCKALITRLVHDGRTDLLDRIAGLFLLASPQIGSLRVPRMLTWLSQDARALKPHSALALDIARTFEDHLLVDRDAVSYDRPVIPTYAVLGASDFWVDQLSAGIGLPTKQKKVASGTHTAVVKPASKDSPIYQWVRDQVNICRARFRYDVFLAIPMAALTTENQYRDYRNDALAIQRMLRDLCGFQSVFYAGDTLESKEKFEAEDFSVTQDLQALRQSKYFMMVYPEKIVSSVLFEAGLAIALGKPSVYFIRNRDSLPFLMKKAEQAELPSGVRIYEYESLARIESLLKNPGQGLWKYFQGKR
jgi:pimeloyl-ACP methyl ester carboxylesterase